MLLKWARWLPYWVVVKLTKNTYSIDGHGILKLDVEYKIRYYQMGDGEFMVFSKENYDMLVAKRNEKSVKKQQKKIDKINKMLDSDCSLKNELKEQFEFEKENEEEY